MKSKDLAGLGNVNIELTNRCNKACWMCGRRKVEVDYPELTLKYGDMDFVLVKKISLQLPPNMVVQLHNNGEALLYPRFGDAVKLFRKQITNIVTNGKLLVEKADEIINNLDTMAISIIENDTEAEEQLKLIKKFLKLKGDKKPFTILRLNGQVDVNKYKKLGLTMATRILHSPLGSFNYKRNIPTIPEIGICWDFLHHLAINKDGLASICVRFDPKGLGVIGDVKKDTLLKIWNSSKRIKWLQLHKKGLRSEIPLCSYCHFWGVPTSGLVVDSNSTVNEKRVFNK
jgi:MoaA/NifB/PqqE/SkfB family radical SAM enzyme